MISLSATLLLLPALVWLTVYALKGRDVADVPAIITFIAVSLVAVPIIGLFYISFSWGMAADLVNRASYAWERGWREVACDKRPDWRWTPESSSDDAGQFRKCPQVQVSNFQTLEWIDFPNWVRERPLVTPAYRKGVPGIQNEKRGPDAIDFLNDPIAATQKWSSQSDGLFALKAAMTELGEPSWSVCYEIMKNSEKETCRSLLRAYLSDLISERNSRLKRNIIEATLFLPKYILPCAALFAVIMASKWGWTLHELLYGAAWGAGLFSGFIVILLVFGFTAQYIGGYIRDRQLFAPISRYCPDCRTSNLPGYLRIYRNRIKSGHCPRCETLLRTAVAESYS